MLVQDFFNQGQGSTIDLTDMTFIIWYLVTFLIFLILLTIFLKLALGLVKSKHNDFGEVFVTTFVIILVIAILFLFRLGLLAFLIGLLLMWVIISSRHETGFLGAIVVSILALIIAFIILILIGIVLTAIGITLITFF